MEMALAKGHSTSPSLVGHSRWCSSTNALVCPSKERNGGNKENRRSLMRNRTCFRILAIISLSSFHAAAYVCSECRSCCPPVASSWQRTSPGRGKKPPSLARAPFKEFPGFIICGCNKKLHFVLQKENNRSVRLEP